MQRLVESVKIALGGLRAGAASFLKRQSRFRMPVRVRKALSKAEKSLKGLCAPHPYIESLTMMRCEIVVRFGILCPSCLRIKDSTNVVPISSTL